MFYWQLTYGVLPWWLIAGYYCSWVGVGGTSMGSAYSLAHKEGHYYAFYQKWLRDIVGHFFENWLGVFWGNIPWNFTTSHVYIHHRLDGGMGDTFYEWDLDRSSMADFMLYISRIFMHIIGYSSLKYFYAQGQKAKAVQLETGMKVYWGVILAILAITRSPAFVFWVILEPLFCMNYFLALINMGYHGFIEFDQDGKHVDMVNSSAIVDGEDDFFGEDDHMAHHYNTGVYFRDLPDHQASQKEEYKRVRASVFQKLSIIELSIFIVLGLWDKLADHYVDYTGKMSREEIKAMLKERAQRKETTYELYQAYLSNPTPEARELLIRESASIKPLLAATAGAGAGPSASGAGSTSAAAAAPTAAEVDSASERFMFSESLSSSTTI